MKNNEISDIIDRFLLDEKGVNRALGRYQSWNIIHEDFSNYTDTDYLARSLAIYLASWGMMRGSSKLLTDFNYLIHIEAVELVCASLAEIKSYPENEEEIIPYVDRVWQVKVALTDYYTSKEVSATDTLISKILLVVSASTPAYDQFFKKYLRHNGINQTLGKKSLIEVWKFWLEKKDCIQRNDYPPMKLVDMAGFQFGLEN